jgi:hypothetical protein
MGWRTREKTGLTGADFRFRSAKPDWLPAHGLKVVAALSPYSAESSAAGRLLLRTQMSFETMGAA